MIRIEDVQFRYPSGEFVLRIDQFEVEPKTRVAVIGPSGSGKTTLLNIISGVIVPGRGRVMINGVDVSALPDPARRDFRISNIGMIFQEFELLEYLDVADNILLSYRIARGLSLDREVRARAIELAGQTGITPYSTRFPGHLSQGERQRVAICRALLTQPALILADEPTGSLDPVSRDRVLEILLDYTRRHHATLLTVTHDRDLLDHFDRVVDLREFSRPSGSAQ